MLFRGTERNRCGIFRQKLKRRTGHIKSIKLRYIATVGTYRQIPAGLCVYSYIEDSYG